MTGLGCSSVNRSLGHTVSLPISTSAWSRESDFLGESVQMKCTESTLQSNKVYGAKIFCPFILVLTH